jgi:rhamnose utilization protein RhaD (predicted bifunctional aldolase and dehydrogenase)
MQRKQRTLDHFCATLGKDRLLIQGPGGNISEKEGDILWIKASGTWLRNANIENIFVPVNLLDLNRNILNENFDANPITLCKTILTPSIETTLHVVMTQKYVVHLHAVEILAHLVKANWHASLNLIADSIEPGLIRPILVKYFKPGPMLAREISQILKINPRINTILLKNHGIVIGANSLLDCQEMIDHLIKIFSLKPTRFTFKPLQVVPSQIRSQFIPFPIKDVHALAQDPNLFKRLEADWALYPDHIVFLGSKSNTYKSWDHFLKLNLLSDNIPELVFIENIGVYINPKFSQTKIAQLLCYFDVISRIDPSAKLDSLSNEAIDELATWDAENYRKNLSS